MDAVQIVSVTVLLTNQNVKTMEGIMMQVLLQLVLNVVLLVLDVLEMLPLVHNVLMVISEQIVHQLVILSV